SCINATGVFAETVMQLDEPNPGIAVSPSQGIHLVVDQSFFPGQQALIIPKTDDGRVLFAVPWQGKVILGTTDTPVNTITAEPQPTEAEIDFVISHFNRYCSKSITRADVLS
ncbi:MAG TPA: FAD-dependent oxidoreductase, partial [Chitinophagaceae bacterium]|nr:FAD-dependent oxidoreductase [Chitinophagaceae bacterium]